MSQANQGLWLSRLANSDLSAKRFYAMKLVAGNLIDVVSGTSDVVVGWLQNKPVAGKIASVACGPSGTCKAQASAAIVEGSYVKVDGSGLIVTGGGSGDRNYGLALEASSASGDIIEILPFAQVLVT